MKNNTLTVGIIAVIIGLIGGFAISNATGDKSENVATKQNETSSGMMASLEGKTGTDFDLAFIDAMTEHHRSAVEMAQLAQQSTTRPELLKLAEDIITAQTSEIDMMGRWRAAWFPDAAQAPVTSGDDAAPGSAVHGQ